MSVINGSDYNKSNIGSLLCGVYYYCLSRTNAMKDDSAVIGFCDAIETVAFNPFIEENELSLVKVPFDDEKYGAIGNGVQANVYRVKGVNLGDKLLRTLPLNSQNKQSNYDISKLKYYPYRYFLVTDYINPPLLIKPQLLKNNEIAVWVKRPISQNCTYNLYVKNYKGDEDGNLEGNISTKSMLFPVSSSAYSQFMSSSSASFNTGVANALLENDISLKQNMKMAQVNDISTLVSGIGNLIGSLATGNVGGAVGGAVSTGFDYYKNQLNKQFTQQNASYNAYNIESQAMAKTTDLLNTPKCLKTGGTDAIFNLNNSKQKVDVIEYGLKQEQFNRLQNYFLRYGYKVNEYGGVNFKSRKYYNFVKTNTIEIKSNIMSKDEINQLADIFNNGITFWHVDNGAEIGEYHVENVEV